MGTPISEILTQALATRSIPVAPYDFIVSIDSTGLITASPTRTPFTVVTGTDFGAVINKCVAQILKTPVGLSGLIYVEPNIQDTTTTGFYNFATAIDLKFVTALITDAGFFNIGATLQWTGVSGATVIANAGQLRGLTFRAKAGSGYKVTDGGGGCSFYDLFAFGSVFTLVLGGSSVAHGLGGINVELSGTNNIVDGFSGGTITIDAGSTGNHVSGQWPVLGVTDNSGGINYLENSGLLGSIVAPAVAVGPTTNSKGTKIQVIVSVGATGTTVSKNGTAVTAAGVTNQTVSVELNEGETITLSQTANVTWTWWAV